MRQAFSLIVVASTDRLAAMEGQSAQQRWLVPQAQALTADLTEIRWLLVEQEALGIQLQPS